MAHLRAGTAAVAAPRQRALRVAQCRTLALLFLGYASCYFCRSNLSVATPLIVEELGRHGISHDRALVAIGSMASWGVIAYALGKCFLTGLGDYWGGKRNLLIATGGAALFTLLFASGSALPLFTLAWIGNRMTQSIGWSALIKVSSKWFHYSRYGTVAAILTCSYLLGDALARHTMGQLLEHGATWRALFVFGAGIAGIMFLANLVFLRESRVEEGHPEALAHPLNVFSSEPYRPTGYLTLVRPLLRSRAFLVVCLLNFGATMVRETFNTWTPTYLHDFLDYASSHAAALSAIFPGVGAISVLLCGFTSDRLGAHTRTLLLVTGLAATAGALLLLTTMHPATAGRLAPVLVIGLVAFCLLGPYSFLPGAFALDFGGKQAGAVASGLIDGTGYLGGALAGWAMARIATDYGWNGVFVTLALVSTLAALGAAYLYVLTAGPARTA
ncbi:MAG: MFS transporter [Proteobacteria bacterium]|nr:MFS transporter [Pseudomonadota bacterium]